MSKHRRVRSSDRTRALRARSFDRTQALRARLASLDMGGRHRRVRKGGRRRAPSEALATLGARNFRRYLIGQLVSNIGTWMQRAAQDLLVLQLTGNSGSAVGILTALQFLPQTLFGLSGGVFADRFAKRRLLIVTQSAMGVQSLVLGVLTVTGAVNLWAVYLLAFLLGTATALDSPARNAFVPELVGKERLANAVSLNSAQFNAARAIGPAVAGLAVAAAGTGPVFLVNAASYLAVLYGLIAIRADALHAPKEKNPANTRMSDAFRAIRANPELLLPITVIAFVGTFGFNFQVTISLIALTVFNSGSAAYGYLSAAYAIGSLVGALRGAGRRKPPTARRLVTATVVFGTLEALAGLMPGYVTFLLVLLPTGLASVTVMTTANAMTQLNADPSMRGRVVSVYLLVLLGGTPVGAPLVGLVSDSLGARFSLVLGGAISAVAAIVLSAVITARSRTTRERTPLTAVASPPPISIDGRFHPESTPQSVARRPAA
ncbi:MFS transporter [Streptomyces sp. HUAS TT20]|uniref:MFS transporter n=1 Tax=Streptomyces sp. HUAS TT20 TaxID=3447509 RepID=UPI0021DA8222|nr:MFS transporter [Streptomyces sp. HUAS 15-9]UXY28233.1 MFS transporter [Streptomyces sp. HUAS 15-9]